MVGEKEEVFRFPRDLLGYYSPYFRACFKEGAFKESKEGILRLPDDNPLFFELIGAYVRDGDAELTAPAVEDKVKLSLDLIRFADKYDFVELVSVAKEALSSCMTSSYSLHDGMVLIILSCSEKDLDTALELLP